MHIKGADVEDGGCLLWKCKVGTVLLSVRMVAARLRLVSSWLSRTLHMCTDLSSGFAETLFGRKVFAKIVYFISLFSGRIKKGGGDI